MEGQFNNQQPGAQVPPQQTAQQAVYEPQQQAYQQQAQPQYTQQPQPGYQAPVLPQSPFAMSWNEIKDTPNWIQKVLFRGLIGAVPILNFCLYGYSGQWAAEASDGNHRGMPEKVVDSNSFTKGFFYCLILFIIGLALSLCNIIPLIGQIVFFVGSIFTYTVANVMYLRYLKFGNFGAAFDVKDIVDKMKRNFGKLFCASFLPLLITGAIGGFVGGTVMGIGALVAVGGVASTMSYTSSSASIAGIIGSLGGMSIFLILGMFIIMLATAVGIIWSLRGTGIWCEQNVPEWNSVATAQYNAERAAQQAAQQAQYQAQQQAYQQQAAAQAAQQQAYTQYQQPVQQPAPQPVQQPMQQPVQQPAQAPVQQQVVQQPTTQVYGQNGYTQIPPMQ